MSSQPYSSLSSFFTLNSHKKESLKTTAKGTGIAAVTGATVGATMAVLTNKPVRLFSVTTGLNFGIFGATFFTVRETFLTYQLSKNPLYGLREYETRDFDHAVSSSMAGITTGGLLSAVYRGPRAVLSGAILFGVLCTGVQVIYSGANRWRQDKIMQQETMSDIHAKSLWEYIHIPSWSPVRKLSNEEYAEILESKLKSLEEEVLLIEKELNA
ncbi:hypothetical protein BDF14DRAFT_1746084 [Spinellus fusiger]|nr:hypothetical protein BDF14DRAFT_1746084 [Spinellus fusiger]